MTRLAPRVIALVVAAPLLLTSGLIRSASAQQSLIPARSDISFTSRQMGVPVDGRFRRFDVQLAFDPKKPETGHVTLNIDTGSATLGAPDTDAELARPSWFHTAKFPRATFQSSAIKALGGGKFEVAGKLSIKGVTRDVVVPLSLTQTAGTSLASGGFTLKRLEFKIGDGEWADPALVANDVQVKFRLAFSGIGTP